MANIEVIMCGFVLALMLADIVSGCAAAFRNGEFSSSVFRDGLWKKLGSCLVLALAEAVEHWGVFVGFDESICSVLGLGICALLAFMEVTSILENACTLNPDLPMARIFALFDIERGDDEHGE